MIEKGNVIKTTFRKLGKIDLYNDNKSDEYIVASSAFDDIIDNVAKETAFLFNSTTVKLTSYGKNDLGENKFNLPIDYLNIIRASEKYRLEGEFLYSPSQEIFIQYCREIEPSEIPNNIFDYIVACLCVEMCLSFNAYQNRLGYFEDIKNKEKFKIIVQQGYNNNPWG